MNVTILVKRKLKNHVLVVSIGVSVFMLFEESVEAKGMDCGLLPNCLAIVTITILH